MQHELSVEIDRPIEAVFERTLNDVAEWSLTCVEDQLLEEVDGGGVGTRFRIVTEDRGKRMDFEGVITRHEPPTLSESHMVGQYFDITALYLFEDLGGRTRVTQEAQVNGKGFMKLMILFMGLFMKKSSCEAMQKELESLKRHCEARIPAAVA
ncbi:MAG: hypothetical protein P1V81_04695 [Planctomycetota bacterium]|nr:hypothetical protein [Planctomycetota bacterium]